MEKGSNSGIFNGFFKKSISKIVKNFEKQTNKKICKLDYIEV